MNLCGALVATTSASRRGAEVEAAAIVQGLRARGMDAVGVALAPATGESLDLKVLGRSPLHARTVYALRRRAAAARITVAFGSRALPATALALVGTRARFLYRSIGDPTYWAGSSMRRARTAALLRRAEGVIALYPKAADDFATRFGVDRAVVIPNGRSPHQFYAATDEERFFAKEALTVPAAAPLAVFVGALSEEKRLDVTIEAVGRTESMWLAVIGDGPQAAEVRVLAQRRLPGRHVLTGSLADVRPALAAADVVVLTSDTEGLPGALIEASLMERPVVATGVGGVSHVVLDGRTGILVPPGDPQSTSAALEHALDRAAEFGAAGREWCIEQFDLEVILDRWQNLLSSWIDR